MAPPCSEPVRWVQKAYKGCDPVAGRRLVMDTSIFENPEALARLASLNPLQDGYAYAAELKGDSSSTTRASGKRTIAKSGGKVAA